MCVCVRFSSVQRPSVCVCLHVWGCFCVFLIALSMITAVPKSTLTPESLVRIYYSHRLFLFARDPLLAHISSLLDSLQGPSLALYRPRLPPPPTDYWSSFILLRAEPAWNHSICVSLKVWLREMDSSLPSLCFRTAVTGLPGAKDFSPVMEILSSGRILL